MMTHFSFVIIVNIFEKVITRVNNKIFLIKQTQISMASERIIQ